MVGTWKATAVVVLAGALLLAWNLRGDYESIRANQFRVLEESGRLAATRISGVLRSVDVGLQSLVADQLAKPRLSEQLITQRQRAFLEQFPEVRAVTAIDPEGNITAWDSVDMWQELKESLSGFNAAQRDYFAFHRDATPGQYHHIFRSRLFLGILKTHVVSFSRAVRDKDGEFLGVVSATITPRVFEPVLREIIANPQVDAAAVHNRHGDILYRLPDAEKHVGKNVVNGEAFQKYLRSDESITRYTGVTVTDNVKRILVFAKVDETDLDVGVSLRYDHVIQEWRRIALLKCLLFLAFAALSIALTRTMKRRQAVWAELRESEGRFRLMASSVKDYAIIMLDEAGRVTSWNEGAQRLTGYEEGEILGREFACFYCPEDAAAGVPRRLLADAAEQGRSEIEAVRVRKDGSVFSADVVITTLRAHNGALKGYVEIVRDISERKEAEQELHAHRDHLEALVADRTAELQTAKEVAEVANGAKSAFLANMSHEIRTPINAILGMLYLSRQEAMSDHLRARLTKAHGAAQLLLGIINDILDFSKIEAGKLEIEQVEFELDPVLLRLIDTIGIQAGNKRVEFLIRQDRELPSRLIGDPLRLSQIVLNLCSNAVKFTEHGEIELGISRGESRDGKVEIRIDVRDSGIGMAPEVQARLFEKFTQADQSTTRRFGGTGLGLAICKNLVELMGGRIWISRSELGQGTTISLTLALGLPAAVTSCGEALKSLVGDRFAGSPKVLLVTENVNLRLMLADILAFAGIESSFVPDFQMAQRIVEEAETGEIAVCIVDWNLLIDGGLTQLPGSRKDGTRWLLLASGSDLEMVVQAGADGILVKPVLAPALFDTLSFLLGRGRILQQEVERWVVPTHRGGGRTFTGAHLLLVEDNEINREFAGELLRSWGLRVDEAVDGAQAVAKAQASNYDGILMDVQMPVMGGLDATRHIRALGGQAGNERLAGIPIIAMTALAMAGDIDECRAAGMNDHISKPIDPEKLLDRLECWIKPAAPGAQPQAMVETSPPNAPAKAAEAPAADALDVAAAVRRVGGNRALYLRLLKRFRDTYPDALAAMQQLAAIQGMAAAEAYCHSLKGVCGNIGADGLYAALDRMDKELKADRWPDEALLDELGRQLREVFRAIESLEG